MSMHENHLDELEQKYPGFKLAYQAFINSGLKITYETGEEWFYNSLIKE